MNREVALPGAAATITTGPGEQTVPLNIKVLQDQDYESRLRELHRERDAEMNAIKQYTSDVLLEREDISEVDLMDITNVLNTIIRLQAAQQDELLHGIPEFVKSGAKPEDVQDHIMQNMLKYQDEEDEALERMKEIMNRGVQDKTGKKGKGKGKGKGKKAATPPEPNTRVLRQRKGGATEAGTSKEDTPEPGTSKDGVPDAVPGPSTEPDGSNVDPFREGLVRHITRIVELNRQVREASLSQNVALLGKLPKDGRLLGMVVLPHQRHDPDSDTESNDNPDNLPWRKDTVVQSLREGEAVWIPAAPGEQPVPVRGLVVPPGTQLPAVPGGTLTGLQAITAPVVPPAAGQAPLRLERRNAVVEQNLEEQLEQLRERLQRQQGEVQERLQQQYQGTAIRDMGEPVEDAPPASKKPRVEEAGEPLNAGMLDVEVADVGQSEAHGQVAEGGRYGFKMEEHEGGMQISLEFIPDEVEDGQPAEPTAPEVDNNTVTPAAPARRVLRPRRNAAAPAQGGNARRAEQANGDAPPQEAAPAQPEAAPRRGRRRQAAQPPDERALPPRRRARRQ